ncbi:MAG: hypothetical protein AB1632_02160 [Nitrospirota bacterium]
MERRSSRRREVHGAVNGKMILAEHVDIMDLSLSGIRFKCCRRVDMNSIQRILIRKQDISVSLKGKVIRSTLKEIEITGGKNSPVYEVAMNFRELTDDDKLSLEKIINIIENG